MNKGITHAHLGPIWYHSEPSDVPYFPNQFLGCDFDCRFLPQDSFNELKNPDWFVLLNSKHKEKTTYVYIYLLTLPIFTYTSKLLYDEFVNL